MAQTEDPVCSAPRRIEFALHGHAENVFLVRDLVDQAALSWALPKSICNDARLILSEIATNACRLYRHHVIKAWVAMPTPKMLEVAVWDPDPFSSPQMREPTDDDESGRGLRLVDAFATDWGWFPSETTGGKVVWARLVW